MTLVVSVAWNAYRLLVSSWSWVLCVLVRTTVVWWVILVRWLSGPSR